MEQISRKLADTTWLQISQSAVDEIIPDQKKLMNNQPYLAQFIIQFTEDYPDAVSDFSLHLTHIVWKIYNLLSGESLQTIQLDDVVNIIKEREKWIETFQQLELEKLVGLIHREKTFNQPNVLSFILDVLVEEKEDNPDFGETDHLYILWLILIVLDAFDGLN